MNKVKVRILGLEYVGVLILMSLQKNIRLKIKKISRSIFLIA